MLNTTKLDPTTNLISRHGHIIGRAIPSIEMVPPCIFPRHVLEIIDREGKSHGKAIAWYNGPSIYETPEEVAAAIPSYMDMLAPDGEMLTRCKQRRDMAAFQVRLCRTQWAKMRKDTRDGYPVASQRSRELLFQTYRQAQKDARRWTLRAIEQEAADIAALASMRGTVQLIDGIWGSLAR